jgi:hypothetical protein
MKTVSALVLIIASQGAVLAEEVIIGSQQSASSYPYCGS